MMTVTSRPQAVPAARDGRLSCTQPTKRHAALSDLPDELLDNIAKRIPAQDYGSMRLLNRHTRDVLDRSVQQLALRGDVDIPAFIERFAQVRTLDLHGCSRLTSSALRSLASLPALTRLNIARLSRRDQRRQLIDFSPLGKLRTLRSLNLEGNMYFGDRGAEVIATLPELRFLRIAGCAKITDRGVAALAGLPKLESLDLARVSQITDEGIAALASATRITALNFQGMDAMRRISPAGLTHLGAMKSLQFLNITHLAALDDEGVSKLVEISSLVHLCLPFTDAMTARSARLLTKLPNLESLHLSHDRAPDVDFLLPLIALSKLREVSCYRLSPAVRAAFTEASAHRPACRLVDQTDPAPHTALTYRSYLADDAWKKP